jgi:Type IV secretion system pilin
MKALILSLFVLMGLAVPVVSCAQAPANPLQEACSKSNDAKNKSSACVDSGGVGSGNDQKNPIYGSNGILNNVADGVALVAGSIAVIYIVLGGFRMITSTGDSQAFKEARSTLIYGAVGLIVVSFARAIVGFVLGRLA